MNEHACVAVYQGIGVSVYQCIGVSVYQCIGVSVYRCIGVSVYQRISVSVYQHLSLVPGHRCVVHAKEACAVARDSVGAGEFMQISACM